MGHTNELNLSPNWPDVLSDHLQECGLPRAAETMGKFGTNVSIIGLGRSLPSYLQNKQSHTAQQGALKFSLSNLSKLWSWLPMAPFQVMCPGFFSQEKRICKESVCLCLTWVSLACCSWDIATVVDLLATNGSYILWDKSLSNLPKGDLRKVKL